MIRISFLITLLLSSALAGRTAAQTAGVPTPMTITPPPSGSRSGNPHQPNRMPPQAERYYGLVWGIHTLSVKLIESGELVRFSYNVLDSVKAQALNEKKSQPFLVDPQARVKLVVPQLEQVGMLRQSPIPEAGKSYWMAFSNKGGVVKRGDHIDIVIGTFRAEGLVVE